MEIIDQNENLTQVSYVKPVEKNSFLVNLLISFSRGRISSKKQAHYVFIIIFALSVITTLYLLEIKPLVQGPGEGAEAAASHHK